MPLSLRNRLVFRLMNSTSVVAAGMFLELFPAPLFRALLPCLLHVPVVLLRPLSHLGFVGMNIHTVCPPFPSLSVCVCVKIWNQRSPFGVKSRVRYENLLDASLDANFHACLM